MILILLVFLSVSTFSWSQQSPYFLKYQHYQKADVSTGSSQTQNLSVGFHAKSVGITIPIYLGKTNKFVLSPIYKQHDTFLSGGDETTNLGRVDQLKSASLGMIYLRSVLNHTYMIRLVPKFASNESRYDSHSFQSLGSFLYLTKEDSLRFGYGVLYSSQFGQPLVLPLLVYVDKNELWEWRLVFPNKAEVYRSLLPNLKLGTALKVSGDRYRLYDSYEVDGLNFSNLNASISLFYLYKDIGVKFSLGRTLFRRFEMYRGNDKVDDLSFEPSYVYSLEIDFLPGRSKK